MLQICRNGQSVEKILNHHVQRICLKRYKKKRRNRHNLFLGAETAGPVASKFETLIPLV